MESHELYALGADRSARFARRFLDHFLPNREPSADEYRVPRFAEIPDVVLTTESEILDYLERHPKEPFDLYWDEASPRSGTQAMLFYTNDGKVVFGLVLWTDSPGERLEELAAFVGADYAYLGWEEPPPDSSRDFIAFCRRTRGFAITPGK